MQNRQIKYLWNLCEKAEDRNPPDYYFSFSRTALSGVAEGVVIRRCPEPRELRRQAPFVGLAYELAEVTGIAVPQPLWNQDDELTGELEFPALIQKIEEPAEMITGEGVSYRSIAQAAYKLYGSDYEARDNLCIRLAARHGFVFADLSAYVHTYAIEQGSR